MCYIWFPFNPSTPQSTAGSRLFQHQPPDVKIIPIDSISARFGLFPVSPLERPIHLWAQPHLRLDSQTNLFLIAAFSTVVTRKRPQEEKDRDQLAEDPRRYPAYAALPLTNSLQTIDPYQLMDGAK